MGPADTIIEAGEEFSSRRGATVSSRQMAENLLNLSILCVRLMADS